MLRTNGADMYVIAGSFRVPSSELSKRDVVPRKGEICLNFCCTENRCIKCGVNNTRSAVSVDTNYLYFASLTGKNLRVMIGEKLNKNSELWF
jgi:hypothetical protein